MDIKPVAYTLLATNLYVVGYNSIYAPDSAKWLKPVPITQTTSAAAAISYTVTLQTLKVATVFTDVSSGSFIFTVRLPPS